MSFKSMIEKEDSKMSPKEKIKHEKGESPAKKKQELKKGKS